MDVSPFQPNATNLTMRVGESRHLALDRDRLHARKRTITLSDPNEIDVDADLAVPDAENVEAIERVSKRGPQLRVALCVIRCAQLLKKHLNGHFHDRAASIDALFESNPRRGGKLWSRPNKRAPRLIRITRISQISNSILQDFQKR